MNALRSRGFDANGVTPPPPSGGAATFSSITDSGLTAGRVVYTGTGGLLSASADFTYSGGTSVALSNNVTAGLQIYNVADQTTNYERLEFLFSANVAQVRTAIGGSGTGRVLRLTTVASGQDAIVVGTTNSGFTIQQYLGIGGTGAGQMTFNFVGSSSAAASRIVANIASTDTSTSGQTAALKIAPIYNQSASTTANADLLINRTETAVGTGAQYWEDRQVGAVSRMATGSAKVLTTDATVTTIQTFTIPASTSWAFDGYVVCRRTGGASGTAEDGASYRVEGVIKNVAGTATSIGSTVTVVGESQVGWDVTVDVTGATARIRVTGASANNISWVWTGNVRQISS